MTKRRTSGPGVEARRRNAAAKIYIAESVRTRSREGCWLDTVARFEQSRGGQLGYQTFDNERVSHMVLRLDGRPREGTAVARHSCDTPACWNPDHLSWGTHAENMADMAARGRAPRGEASGSAKLTSAEVREIRQRREAGETHVALGAEYGIHPSQICRIANGIGWAHIG